MIVANRVITLSRYQSAQTSTSTVYLQRTWLRSYFFISSHFPDLIMRSSEGKSSIIHHHHLSFVSSQICNLITLEGLDWSLFLLYTLQRLSRVFLSDHGAIHSTLLPFLFHKTEAMTQKQWRKQPSLMVMQRNYINMRSLWRHFHDTELCQNTFLIKPPNPMTVCCYDLCITA